MIPKVNEGEHFDNLDLLTTLLAQPKRQQHKSPLIEVISNGMWDKL